MPTTKKSVTSPLTDNQRTILRSAAEAVWNEIGWDCLQARAEDGDVERAEMSRNDVIEVVLDAGRLEEELERKYYKQEDAAVVRAFITDYSTETRRMRDLEMRRIFNCSTYGV